MYGDSGETTLYLVDDTNDDVIQTAKDTSGLTTTNLRFEDLTIRGNRVNNSDAGKGKTGKIAGIRLINVEDAVVKNCHAEDFYGHGFEVKRSKNVTITDCTSSGNGDDGFSVSDVHFDEASTEHVTVADCTATNNDDSGFEVDDGPQHVAFERCVAEGNHDGFCIHTHRSIYAPASPKHVLVERCIARNNTQHGFMPGNHTSGSPEDYVFRHIRAVGNGKAGFTTHPDGSSPSTTPIDGLTVEEFHVEGASSSRPIFSLQYADTLRNVTLRSGTITGTGSIGLSVQGTSFESVTLDNVHVHGADIRNPADTGDVQIHACEPESVSCRRLSSINADG